MVVETTPAMSPHEMTQYLKTADFSQVQVRMKLSYTPEVPSIVEVLASARFSSTHFYSKCVIPEPVFRAPESTGIVDWTSDIDV